MRYLICGGRDFQDRNWLYSEMDSYPDVTYVIQGGAKGADRLASEWAESRQIPQAVYFADWKLFGRAAGPIRNKRMLEEGKPDVVVAFPGGNGTANMVAQAKKAGIKVYECRKYVNQC